MKSFKFYFLNGDNDDYSLEIIIQQFLTHVISNFNKRWSIKNTIPKMEIREIKNALFDEFQHCLYIDKYKILLEYTDIDTLFQMCIKLLRELYNYY